MAQRFGIIRQSAGAFLQMRFRCNSFLSVFSNWFLYWSDFNRVRSPGRGGDAAAFSATGVAFQWVLFCT
jgi:hypothetical protein